MAPHSLAGWIAFTVVAIGLLFIAMFSTLTLWVRQQFVVSHRWQLLIKIASLINALYILATALMLGLYILWTDAIEVWFRQENGLPNKETCYINTISSEHIKVIELHDSLLPSIGGMLCLLLTFCIAVVVVEESLTRGQRRANDT
jgi:hypothetical protein